MLEFLVHKCIKDADEIERPEVRKRYGFFSSIVGIICNVILFAGKLAIGLIAGSISIVSDELTYILSWQIESLGHLSHLFLAHAIRLESHAF